VPAFCRPQMVDAPEAEALCGEIAATNWVCAVLAGVCFLPESARNAAFVNRMVAEHVFPQDLDRSSRRSLKIRLPKDQHRAETGGQPINRSPQGVAT